MEGLMIIVRFINLLSLVFWIGGMSFFSFIAAPAIFKALPRETAGDVVGEIFPKYWAMGYICSTTSLSTLLISSFYETTLPWFSISLLAAMTCLSFYTGIFVGIKARDTKAHVRTATDQSQKEMLREQFKILHRQSAILNVVIISFGLMVLFSMAANWGVK